MSPQLNLDFFFVTKPVFNGAKAKAKIQIKSMENFIQSFSMGLGADVLSPVHICTPDSILQLLRYIKRCMGRQQQKNKYLLKINSTLILIILYQTVIMGPSRKHSNQFSTLFHRWLHLFCLKM